MIGFLLHKSELLPEIKLTDNIKSIPIILRLVYFSKCVKTPLHLKPFSKIDNLPCGRKLSHPLMEQI